MRIKLIKQNVGAFTTKPWVAKKPYKDEIEKSLLK